MRAKHQRYLIKFISALLITSILGIAVLQPIYAATHYQQRYKSPRDYYVQNLLSISNSLEWDPNKDDLGFPHPESRPDSARAARSPYADPSVFASSLNARFGSSTWSLNSSNLHDLSGEVSLYSEKQRPWSRLQRFVNNTLSTPVEPQTQSFIYLPLVLREFSITSPPIVGGKAIFDQLIPDASVLSSELNFTVNQITQVKSVIDDERAAIAVLHSEADAIIEDESLSLEEKRAAIADMSYNERLRAILQNSQTHLENDLGNEAYADLVDWLNTEWDLLVAQRRAIRSTMGVGTKLFATDKTTETCEVFDVYATRSTYADYSADLPDKYVKFANRGWEYSHGYTDTTVYSVTVKYGAEIASNVVVTDVIWNHNDNYWNTITDTLHPRRMFTDLPHGMPEAEAAYFDNYNGGMDEFGQLVTNPAGMNLSQQVADQLGMGGSAWVQVTFPWGCTPTEQWPEQELIAQTWGVSNIGSRYTTELINPVTGNQFTWYRDLYVPAPGLDVDFIRYYNSLDGEDGIYGRGWSSQFDMRVYPQADGSYKVRYEDGRRGFFRPDGTGGFEGSLGTLDTFAVVSSGFVLTKTDATVYTFNGEGRLQTIAEPTGNQITLVYSNGNPVKIIDSMGREFDLTFNHYGHVTQIKDPIGRVASYTYSEVRESPAVLGLSSAAAQSRAQSVSSAALLSSTDPNGNTTYYGYDPQTRALSQSTDPGGVTFGKARYDTQGRVNSMESDKDQLTTFAYQSEDLRTTVTDRLGNTTTYVYNRRHQVIQEIDALGNSVYFKYDEQGNLVEKTDKRGNTWKYAYDDQGHLIRQEDPLDQYSTYGSDVTAWEYNDRGQIVKMTDALGQVTRYEYDDKGNLIKTVEPNGAAMTSEFNVKGQMISMTDAEGRTTQFEYDANGNRTKVIDPYGNTTSITYDAAGRVLSRTDAEGNTTQYEYDGNGNVVKVIDAMGNALRREYDGNNMMVKQIDRTGAVYEFKYDDDLRMIEQKDPLGNVVKYEYDAMGNRTKVVDARGNATTYEYDKLYRVAKITDAAGFTTQYEYDENGNAVKIIDALGGMNRTVYDAVNRTKFVYDAMGYQTEYCYDPLDRVTHIFNPRRALTQYFYDEVGNNIKTIDPLGNVTTMKYDKVHNRIAMTDPNGHTTTYTYDKLNRLIAETDPLGNVFQMEYDKVGNKVKVIDAKGNVSTFAYNDNYWIKRSTNALGKSVIFTYDKEGRQLTAQDQAGNVTSSEYDTAGRVIRDVDALGNVTSFQYDANGNTVAVTDPKGNITHYEYDVRNLMVKEIDPLGNSALSEYDALKRLLGFTDANGKVTTYQYDALGRVTSVTNAEGHSYVYEYDSVGNPTAVTDSNDATIIFEYNFLNQLVREINPLSKTWEYHYDPAGNLVMQVDGEWQPIYYEYDAANQLIQTRYPDGKTVEYEYDANGNQTKMTDWNGTLIDTYDALDRLTSTTDYKGRKTSFTYDDVDNLTGMTYPDGKSVSYDYSVRNELETMTDPAGLDTHYTYDAAGLLTSQVRPNNTRTDFTYDDASRLTNMRTSGAADITLAGYDFTLDKIGNRTQMVETRLDTNSVTYDYQYDNTYQLTNVTSTSGQDLDYAYDPVGNRKTMVGLPEPTPEVTTTESVSVTYEYDDLNSLLRAGDASFSYDANGNRVQTIKPISETRYASFGLTGTVNIDYLFDVENRLVEVRESLNHAVDLGTMTVYTDALVMEADYGYDGMGRRVDKLVQQYDLTGEVISVMLREYVYSGLNVIAEYEYTNGALDPDVNHYYYANGRKVAMEKMPHGEEAEKYWYAYDAQGTTVAMLDADGQIVAEYDHDEYGQLIVGDALLNRYLFTGQEYDPETGFVHFFARYYDSENGVWLTQDTNRGNYMAPATLHRYMYAANNPVNFTDALGYGFLGDLWDTAKETASDAWNGTKKTVAKAVETVDKAVVQPTIEKANNTVETVKKTVDTAIDNAPPVLKKAASTVKESVGKAKNWVDENKESIVNTAVSIGVGIAATAAVTAMCCAPPGLGCVVAAGAIAGAASGFSGTLAGNAVAGRDLRDNLLKNTIVGGVTGAFSAAASYAMPAVGQALVKKIGGGELTKKVTAEGVNFLGSTLIGGGTNTLTDALDGGGFNPWESFKQGAKTGAISYASIRAGQKIVGGLKSRNRFSTNAKEGIYEFTDQKTGETYVGQSGDIDRRLGEHVRSGRLSRVDAAKRTSVSGGKFAREIAEQNRINELGGISNLANKVNPIGPNRVLEALKNGLNRAP